MLFQIVLILFLTAINALFVMAEMAIVSVRRSRLEELRDDGDNRAKIALELLRAPEHFLSTTQAGITLITVLSGAVGGASMAHHLEPLFESVPLLASHAADISFGIIVFIITYLSLILGELVPKRWALSHAETLTLTLAIPLRATMMVSYPIIRLFTRSADIAMTTLRIPRYVESPVSEEEIKIMLEHGERAGVVEGVEKEMIERVFRLGDKPLDSVMTHRSEMVWVDIDEVSSDTWLKLAESGHSYFPVCKGGVDEVIGLLSIKDIWLKSVKGEEIDIHRLIVKPLMLPGAISALRALELFRESKSHIALVVDEYGSVDGLATITDIVEAVLGQLPSQDQDSEPMIVEREDGSFLLDGALSFDEFLDVMNLQDLEDDERADFQTLAGFIINHLGRFPAIGERFEWSNLRFEIVDMDGHRVDRILVVPPAAKIELSEESDGDASDLKEGNA